MIRMLLQIEQKFYILFYLCAAILSVASDSRARVKYKDNAYITIDLLVVDHFV